MNKSILVALFAMSLSSAAFAGEIGQVTCDSLFIAMGHNVEIQINQTTNHRLVAHTTESFSGRTPAVASFWVGRQQARGRVGAPLYFVDAKRDFVLELQVDAAPIPGRGIRAHVQYEVEGHRVAEELACRFLTIAER